MKNKEYLDRYDNFEEFYKLDKLRKEKGFTYEQLAEKINVNKVWLASAFKGQQWVPDEYIEKIADVLDVEISEVKILGNHPYKADTDPILYRLHEALDTYGPAIKEIIHEKSGNAIMSAIDFGIDVEIEKGENGDRVIIKMDGKLLPYSHQGKYPW
ncbi:MAG: helix-turn-helix domain-containing protein [Sarcina sp.]